MTGHAKCKTRKKIISYHQQFWLNREKEGARDFWLKFAELDIPKSKAQKKDLAEDLNVLEKYAALLFRALPRKILQRDLPNGCKVHPYPWVGLNVCDPMLQFRQASLHGTSIAAKKQGRGFIIYNNKPNTALNILFRYADASKRDKNSVLLKCSVCLSSHYIDRTPRYEISTGAYLATKQDCYMCRSEDPVLFTPIDTSMPFKNTKTLQQRTI